MLLPEITVVVHKVDSKAHPSIQPGWRWSVMVGGQPPGDLDYCANAGWAPSEHEARQIGEQAAATAVKAARMFGVPAAMRQLRLDHDPIRPGADRVSFV